jgi:hypothetical protein
MGPFNQVVPLGISKRLVKHLNLSGLSLFPRKTTGPITDFLTLQQASLKKRNFCAEKWESISQNCQEFHKIGKHFTKLSGISQVVIDRAHITVRRLWFRLDNRPLLGC